MSKAEAKYNLLDQIGEIEEQYILEAEYTEKELQRLKQHGMSVAVVADAVLNKEDPTEPENSADPMFMEHERADMNTSGHVAQPLKSHKTATILWITVGVTLAAAAILLFVFLWNPDRSDVVSTTEADQSVEETESTKAEVDDRRKDEMTLESSSEMTTEVPVDEEHFPDDAFRKYVSEQFDADRNGILDAGEIGKATEIWVAHGVAAGTVFGREYRGFEEKFNDLSGIEYFTSLQILVCSGNDLTELDVSRNRELTSLDCSNNKLATLDISRNTKLTQLICAHNSLTQLDARDNPELSYLRVEDSVVVLDAEKNIRRVSPPSARPAPMITRQPKDLRATPNEKLPLLVEADGEGELSYQWEYKLSDSGAWKEFEQSASRFASFSPEMTQELNGATVRCKVKAGDSQPAYSDAVTLTIIIPVTQDYFPDDIFREHVSRELDQDKDGFLSPDERNVGDLDVSNRSIHSLKGVEFLDVRLLNCAHNLLSSLDLSGNAGLTILNCSDNSLTEIKLSELTFILGELQVDPEVELIGDNESGIDCSIIRRHEASAIPEGWYATYWLAPEPDKTYSSDLDMNAGCFIEVQVENENLCFEGSLQVFDPIASSFEQDCYGYEYVSLPLAGEVKFSSVIHKEETRRLEQDVRQFNEVLQSISQQGAEYLYLEIHITGGYIDEIIIEAWYHDHSGIIEIE